MRRALRNILFIANSPEIGGGNKSLETLASGLLNEGLNPIIIVSEQGPATQMFKEHGFNVLTLKYAQPSFSTPLLTIKQLIHWIYLLHKYHIDIVHANGTLAARSITQATWIYGIPLICHVRSSLGEAFYSYCFKYLPQPAAFIFVSNAMKNSIEPLLRKQCSKASYYAVHNAVILDCNQALIVRDSVERIGIIANLQAVKGHEDFIQMASLLIKDYPDIQFDVVGTDIHNEGREIVLKKLAKQLNLESRIVFHGFIQDVLMFIDNLDIVVCPSHDEPFGRCAIEAMSRGKSVIVTNVGGLPEIVKNGENGFIVHPHHPMELAEACRVLLSNRNLRYEIAKNNVDRVNNVFSQKAHVQRIKEIYLESIKTYNRKFVK